MTPPPSNTIPPDPSAPGDRPGGTDTASTPPPPTPKLLTLGELATRLGLPADKAWKVRRLIDRSLCPVPVHRVGGWRVVSEGDVGRFAGAMREAGYLDGEGEA